MRKYVKKAKRLLREALSFPDEKMETRFKTTMDARSLSIVVTTLSIVVPAFCTVLAVIYLLNPRDPLILQFGIPGLSCTLMYLIYGKLGAQNIIFFDILAFTSQSSMFWAAKYEEGYPLYLLLFPCPTDDACLDPTSSLSQAHGQFYHLHAVL
jgi:hypothetical protein